jgi:hypothetical protein
LHVAFRDQRRAHANCLAAAAPQSWETLLPARCGAVFDRQYRPAIAPGWRASVFGAAYRAFRQSKK